MSHFVENSLNLSRTITTTNHEVISKAAYSTSIKQDNITRLLIAGGFYCLAGYFYCFQELPPMYNRLPNKYYTIIGENSKLPAEGRIIIPGCLATYPPDPLPLIRGEG